MSNISSHICERIPSGASSITLQWHQAMISLAAEKQTGIRTIGKVIPTEKKKKGFLKVDKEMPNADTSNWNKLTYIFSFSNILPEQAMMPFF